MYYRNPSLLFGSGGVSYDTDAQAYFDQVVANGGAALGDVWKTTLNTFFLAMKANLYFTEWDQLHLWYNENEIAARTSIVNPSQPMCTLHGTVPPVFTPFSGMQTDGVDNYIDTQFTPSVDGVKYQLDSAFAGLGMSGNVDGVTVDMGVFSNANGNNIVLETATGGVSYYIINSNINYASPANAAALDADYILMRTAAASIDTYKNNTSSNFAIPSTALPVLNVWIGGINNAGVLGFPKAINVLWHGFGSKLTPVSTFRTDLHATGL